LSITILAIILLSTTNIINLLNKENQKTSTILIAKLDFETTRLYLEKKILIDANLANLTYENNTLYYNNVPLLHNIDSFIKSTSGNFINITICTNKNLKICQDMVFKSN
jgi:hypothetical protein